MRHRATGRFGVTKVIKHEDRIAFSFVSHVCLRYLNNKCIVLDSDRQMYKNTHTIRHIHGSFEYTGWELI